LVGETVGIGRREAQRLRPSDLAVILMQALGEARSRELLGCGGEKALMGEVQIGPEVELGGGGLDQLPADSATVGLLQLQALSQVVIESAVGKYKEPCIQIQVLLKTGGVDAGAYGGFLRLREPAVSARKTNDRVGPLGQPSEGRHRALQVHLGGIAG